MMGAVLNFQKESPHVSGKARCMHCNHEWVAVAPEITEWLECPECHLVRGHFVYPICRTSEPHWTCGCGNDLFHFTPDKTYCPNCGDIQEGF